MLGFCCDDSRTKRGEGTSRGEEVVRLAPEEGRVASTVLCESEQWLCDRLGEGDEQRSWMRGPRASECERRGNQTRTEPTGVIACEREGEVRAFCRWWKERKKRRRKDGVRVSEVQREDG
jgi:hypothetical protein